MTQLPLLRIHDLRLDYVNAETGLSHCAVEGLNLDVREGEFLCVVGPSGCGKSTVISAIAGFLPPSAGILDMDGAPIRHPGADRGVVFQEYALWPWLRVIDNVAFGLKMRGMARGERHSIARRYLAMANLSEAADKYPHELSGGMKQRVAVARTLANSPRIMLMDEPFAAIDAQTRLSLQEELLRIWSASRVTVVFVTHSVEEAVFLADRVAVFSPGPGHVVGEVDIPIARDARRWGSLRSDPVFITARDRILEMMHAKAGVH
jgi:NitT/TauT family transport system ATP-binding protein